MTTRRDLILGLLATAATFGATRPVGAETLRHFSGQRPHAASTQFQARTGQNAEVFPRETIREAGNRRFYEECRDAGGGASSDPDEENNRTCRDANGNNPLD